MTWIAICCAPQREQELLDALVAAGHGAISPTYTAWKIRKKNGMRRQWEGGRWFSRERVLIPHYVFSTVDPDEALTFRSAGAIRALVGRQIETRDFLEDLFTKWAGGIFNDPEPLTKAPSQPVQNRNRKAKRKAGQARREVLGWDRGLQAAKARLDQPVEHLEAA